MNLEILAALIFLATYLIIFTERVHRTLAALLGGMLMIGVGVISQDEAFQALDLNVIFLLAGMMMIAYLLGETGVFQWLAVKAVKAGRGNPVVIMVIIATITAFASALLDNVTVVVLIAPVTLLVASSLGVSPVPFLISEVMASNIGGAATLIGDPPNILVASAADLDFGAFIAVMGPPALFILAAYLVLAVFQFRKRLVVSAERRKAVLRIDTKGMIRNPVLLAKTLIILGLVLLGFLLNERMHLQPATIALGGATILMIWSRRNPIEVLEKVEWGTLMFFVGLFIIVEGITRAGLIDRAAEILLRATEGRVAVATYFILWFSAISSGIVDNIPYTATMIPLIEDLGVAMDIRPLWWALALGADLGGNLTLVGASANLVIASLADRSGHKLGFWEFLRYGIPTVLISLVVSSFWLGIRFLR